MQMNRQKTVPGFVKQRPLLYTPYQDNQANIAFRFSYCDGGANEDQVGFQGLCSEELIKQNTHFIKMPWCSHSMCECRKYYMEKYKYKTYKFTRLQLEELFEKKGGSFCNESNLLNEWTAYAGNRLEDEDYGRPFTIKRADKDHLCVMTTREPGMEEKDRYIFALFIIGDTYEGNLEADGFYDQGWVRANNEYRIIIPSKIARKFLFWKFYKNLKNPLQPFWGSGRFRYLDDSAAYAILAYSLYLLNRTDLETTAIKMLKYFCAVKHIDANKITFSGGALSGNKGKRS